MSVIFVVAATLFRDLDCRMLCYCRRAFVYPQMLRDVRHLGFSAVTRLNSTASTAQELWRRGAYERWMQKLWRYITWQITNVLCIAAKLQAVYVKPKTISLTDLQSNWPLRNWSSSWRIPGCSFSLSRLWNHDMTSASASGSYFAATYNRQSRSAFYGDYNVHICRGIRM